MWRVRSPMWSFPWQNIILYPKCNHSREIASPVLIDQGNYSIWYRPLQFFDSDYMRANFPVFVHLSFLGVLEYSHGKCAYSHWNVQNSMHTVWLMMKRIGTTNSSKYAAGVTYITYKTWANNNYNVLSTGSKNMILKQYASSHACAE